MKKTLCILFVCLFLPLMAENTLPPLNAKVKEYTTSVLGKKVARGECWDLAKAALDYAGANWDGNFKFGREYDPLKEKPLPGDVIQFKGVQMEHREANSLSKWTMAQHTAIVYEVRSSRKLQLAEQNLNGVRKVMLNDYDLDEVKKGKLYFYRPVK